MSKVNYPAIRPKLRMDHIDAIISSGVYHDALSIVKGFRNGLVYGAKIRFPHALVRKVGSFNSRS